MAIPPSPGVSEATRSAAAGFIARHSRGLTYGALALIPIAAAMFLAFLADSTSLGGDALNGYVRDGHYFVASHGSVTEVSRSQWEWDQLLGTLMFITFPLGMASGAFLLFRHVFPAFAISNAPALDVASLVSSVRKSGPCLASDKPGGILGDVRMSRGLLAVDVYPAGIVLRPVLMAPQAVLASEIDSVHPGRRFMVRVLEIDHSGRGARSPIFLYRDEHAPISRAIIQLARGGSAAIPIPPAPMSASPMYDPTSFRQGLALPRRVGSLSGSVSVDLAHLSATGGSPKVVLLTRASQVAAAAVLAFIGFTELLPRFGFIGWIWIVGVIAIGFASARAIARDVMRARARAGGPLPPKTGSNPRTSGE